MTAMLHCIFQHFSRTALVNRALLDCTCSIFILSSFPVFPDVTSVKLMFLQTTDKIIKHDLYRFKISKSFFFACVFRSFRAEIRR